MKISSQPFLAVGVLSSDSGLQYAQARKNFEITWIQQGSGFVNVNGVSHPINNHSVYCGAPGQIQQLHATDDVRGITIAFNETFILQGYEEHAHFTSARLLSEFMKFIVVELNPSLANEFSVLLERMNAESAIEDELKSDLLRYYLRIVLIHIRRQLLTRYPANPMDINFLVKKFLARVEQDYAQVKSVSDYASMLCVTPNYLNQLVKKNLGETAGNFIRKRIILEAKKRVQQSDMSMKEIAYLLGFDSEAHFSIYFKNYAGMTFTEYKKLKKSSGEVPHRVPVLA